MIAFRSCLFGLLLLAAWGEGRGQGIQRVWAVDDGERIKKTVLNHPLATSSDNKVWNGSSISLFGARNEVVAFQLIIQGNSSGATNVNVTLDSLRKSSTPQYTIKNTGGIGDPYNYVGKRIEMFVEHYMNITSRSTAAYIWWSGARPLPDADFTGLIPEQLVPFDAPAGPRANGQGGAPFSVTANQNQGVWVDIYIPRDAAAGDYAGTLKVIEGSTVRYSLPVNLKVYNFALSDTTHLYNMFHIDSPGITDRHGVIKGSSQYWTLMKRYYAMGHRHRADISYGRATLGTLTPNLGGMYTGSYYTAANGYGGPGEGIGNRTYSIGTYDQPRSPTGTDYGSVSGFTYDADTNIFKANWRNASNQWVSWFEANAPGTRIHKYMSDEPGLRDTNIFFDIRRKARWLKTNPGSGRRLKTLVTSNVRPDLRGSVDIWMETSQSGYVNGEFNPYPGGYVVDSANAVRQRGEMAGMYNGTVPAFGAHVIDAPGVYMRVNAWVMWKYNVDLYFLWYINHWGDEDSDPIDPWAADKRNTTNGWGNGSFLYAGQNRDNVANDRGLGGPVAGIRLKNWRRGAQDYEYLHVARQLGINTDAIVDTLVPAAFDQVNQGSRPTYPSRGWQYDSVRRQVAELIAAATSPLPFGSFSAAPGALTSGPGNVTLQWVSTNATSASINNGVGTVPLSGTQTVFVDATRTFILTLTNALGSRTYSTTVTVRLLPSGSFNASPDTLPAPGNTSLLTWTSSNALSARIDPGVGAVNVSGSRQVVVPELTTFTLTLTNNDGSRSYTKSVFIRTPPSGTFNVTPDSIPFEGGSVRLSWTSSNALSASLDHGIGTVEVVDSLALFLSSAAHFTLTLRNPFGSRTYTQQVYQKPFVPRFVSAPPESLVGKDPLSGRVSKPTRRGRSLPPNWANLLSEVVIQGGFEPGSSESDEAGGMVVGISSMDHVGDNKWRPNRDAASVRSWVRLTKWQFSRNNGSSYTAVTASLEGREGPHSGTPRGFDSTGTPGEVGRKLLLKQLTKLAPKKHNNKLFAELVALKVNIAASQIGKTPAGFGELIYDVDSSACDEMMITEIADRADSFLTHWRGRAPQEYADLYNAVRAINRAFVAPMDTVTFESSGQLVLRGVVQLAQAPFLRMGSEPVVMRPPTTRLTTVQDDDLEEGLYEDDENPKTSKLFQNFPNPFNPTTMITVGLREPGLATVEVFNILGQSVAMLMNSEELDEGIHRVEFPAGNLASGVYFYRLTVRNPEDEGLLEVQTRKMLLMK